MPKTTASTSAKERKAHLARLEELREAALGRIEIASNEYEALTEEGGDVGADQDEGGGEADVTSAERDRLRAAIRMDKEALLEIEAAIERAAGPNWDRCSTCGGEIGAARLEAIPSADKCVGCKAASTSF